MLLGIIGKGGQATVREAIDKDTKEAVALKISKKKNMSFWGLNAAYSEYQIMKDLEHPNILQTRAYYEDTNYLIIAYELMSSDVRSLLVELEASLAEQ